MNLKDVATARLISQQIADTKFKKPKELVGWMGAMQAQDFGMAKWAIGVRLPGSTNKIVQAAIDKGDILRTHVMRPTWHFVLAEDIHWMLTLTAPHIKGGMKGRHKQLELTSSVLKKTNRIIEAALSHGKHLTREELLAKVEKAKIYTGNYRSGHIMLWAELEGLVCSGVTSEKKQTYALLAQRVTKKKVLDREEALAKLAKKYFSSHCPASLQDFIWWSGLPVADAKRALEINKRDLVAKTIGLETYWLDKNFSFQKIKPSVYLLPAYDEFLISYKNRSASLPEKYRITALSGNGIFYPVIISNGQVTGLWKRTLGKSGIDVKFDFFNPLNTKQSTALRKEMKRFQDFVGTRVNCEL